MLRTRTLSARFNVSIYSMVYGLWSNYLVLINSRIVRVVESFIFKWPVEPGTVIRSHGKLFLQSVHQIWVTGEVTAIQESIVFTGFNNSPGVLVIPTASGEERG